MALYDEVIESLEAIEQDTDAPPTKALTAIDAGLPLTSKNLQMIWSWRSCHVFPHVVGDGMLPDAIVSMPKKTSVILFSVAKKTESYG